MYETKPYFYGTGRRKDSVARVRVYTGTGKITINDRDIDNYFGLETLKLIVRSPPVSYTHLCSITPAELSQWTVCGSRPAALSAWNALTNSACCSAV